MKKYRGRKRKIKHLENVPQVKRRVATFIAMFELATKDWTGDEMLELLLLGNRGLVSQSDDSLIEKFEEYYNQAIDKSWHANYSTPFKTLRDKETKRNDWSRRHNDVDATTDILRTEAIALMDDLFEDIIFK